MTCISMRQVNVVMSLSRILWTNNCLVLRVLVLANAEEALHFEVSALKSDEV